MNLISICFTSLSLTDGLTNGKYTIYTFDSLVLNYKIAFDFIMDMRIPTV